MVSRRKQESRKPFRIPYSFALLAVGGVFAVLLLGGGKVPVRLWHSLIGTPPVRETSVSHLTVDFGDGRRRAFRGPVEAGMTILAALRASGAAGGFDVATDDEGRLAAVAGVPDGAEKHWRMYRNGASISDIPGHVPLAAGDSIILRYE